MLENNAAPTPENQFMPTPETTNDSVLSTFAPAQSSVTPSMSSSKPTRRFLPKLWHKVLFSLLIVVLLLGSVSAVLGFYTYQTLMTLKSQALEAKVIAGGAKDQFKTQNLPAAEAELKRLQEKTIEIRQTYDKLAFYQYVPVARAYYMDGVHGLNAGDAGLNAGLKSIQTITPYADVLGFAGEGTFTGGTIEDRLKLLLQTLEKVTPKIDEITADMQVVEREMAQINPNRYPEQLKGIPVRGYVTQAQALSTGAVTALTDYRPVLEQLPAMAGSGNQKRRYLVLFQNDNELRPTGGFLTAYAIINLENGKVNPEKSDDIYELDKVFTKNLPIPDALGRYLTTEKKWNLRDMNTSPDFKVSMDQFMTNYGTIRGAEKSIDGVIAIDTHVLTDLMKVLGPVNVPGYATFTAENDKRCDCPNIIYELSNIITRPTPYMRTDRKGVLGPLMREVLTKFYTAPKQQWPAVFEAAMGPFDERGKGGWIGGRHVQAYFYDEKFQKAAEAINLAGRITPTASNTDFLGIVDANLGGAKSNLFIDYEVKQTVSAPENGLITKTVEITYKNNRKADNCNLEAGLLCLNSTLRDWNRLYLPAGAKLVESQGFTQQPKAYEEQGFSVIDGFFILEPNSQAKVKVSYTVPYTDAQTYRLQVWKQGGIGPVKHLIDVNGTQEEVVVNRDQLIEVAF